MQEICRLLDIDKQHISFNHPETNAVPERFHGTLNSMMGRVVSENQKDWAIAYLTFLLRIDRRHISRQCLSFSCLREE